MTDQELKDLVASLAIDRKETDRQMREHREDIKALQEEARKREEEARKREEERRKREEERRKRQEEERKREEETQKRAKEEERKREEERRKRQEEARQRDDQLKKETAKQMKASSEETNQYIKKLSLLVGNISNNQGEIIEEQFYQSLKKNKKLGKLSFDYIDRNVHLSIGRLEDEYDIILFNGDSVALVEVKTKAHPDDIKKIVKKKVASFKELRPAKLDNQKIYLAVASGTTNKELVKQAKKEGVFLLTLDGKHIEMANEEVKAY